MPLFFDFERKRASISPPGRSKKRLTLLATENSRGCILPSQAPIAQASEHWKRVSRLLHGVLPYMGVDRAHLLAIVADHFHHNRC